MTSVLVETVTASLGGSHLPGINGEETRLGGFERVLRDTNGAPPKRQRIVKSAAPRLAQQHLSEIGQQWTKATQLKAPNDATETGGISCWTNTTRQASHSGESRWRSSSGEVPLLRPRSSQAHTSSGFRGGMMDRRRSVSAPGALDSTNTSTVELPRIPRSRINSAMPRISGPRKQSMVLDLSRPTSALGNNRQQLSPSAPWPSLLEEDEEETGGLAFSDSDDEWILDEKDIGKRKDLKRLLIVKKLDVLEREQMVDWQPGEIKIPQFHCERCRDYWLRHGRLPDECPEEKRRRLAMLAEEARRRASGSWRSGRHRRKGTGSGFSDSCSDENTSDGEGSGRRRRHRKNSKLGDGLDGDSSLLSSNDRQQRAGAGGLQGNGGEGGDGSGLCGQSGKSHGDGKSGDKLNDDGDLQRTNSFIGADGKRYIGGQVSKDFNVGEIPGFGGDGKGLGDGQLRGDGKRSGLLDGLSFGRPGVGDDKERTNAGGGKSFGNGSNADGEGVGGIGSGKGNVGGDASDSDKVLFGRRRGSRRNSIVDTDITDPFGKGVGGGSVDGDRQDDDQGGAYGKTWQGRRGRQGDGDNERTRNLSTFCTGRGQNTQSANPGGDAGEGNILNAGSHGDSDSGGCSDDDFDASGSCRGQRRLGNSTGCDDNFGEDSKRKGRRARDFTMEDIQDLFTRPWSFSYFVPSKHHNSYNEGARKKATGKTLP